MKLNSPETAPKDGTQILGYFKHPILCDFKYPLLSLAVWNEYHKAWSTCTLQTSFVDGIRDAYYETELNRNEDLKGWLPMINSLTNMDGE